MVNFVLKGNIYSRCSSCRLILENLAGHTLLLLNAFPKFMHYTAIFQVRSATRCVEYQYFLHWYWYLLFLYML